MNCRYMIAVLLAGVLFVVLSGCNGSTQATNPTVTFTSPVGNQNGAITNTPTVTAGQILNIQGTVALGTTDPAGDAIKDSIASESWTQSGMMLGTFSFLNTINTTWQAPAWIGPGNENVVLTFTVTTVLGGKTVQNLNITVTPA